MTDAPRRFWIGVISREHIHVGVKGGFIQLGHGKKARCNAFVRATGWRCIRLEPPIPTVNHCRPSPQ